MKRSYVPCLMSHFSTLSFRGCIVLPSQAVISGKELAQSLSFSQAFVAFVMWAGLMCLSVSLFVMSTATLFGVGDQLCGAAVRES